MTVDSLFAGSAEFPFDLKREVSCMGQHRQGHDWDETQVPWPGLLGGSSGASDGM